MEQRLGPAPTGFGAIAKMRLASRKQSDFPFLIGIKSPEYFLKLIRLPGSHGPG